MNSRSSVGAFVIYTGVLLGFAQPPVSVISQPQSTTRAYVLGQDDQLKIWALGVEEISDKPVRIGPGGDLDLPLIGNVHASGLTVEQLKEELVARLSREIRKPQVSVEIVDFGSQPVSIMGAVNHPGVYQLRGRRLLVEVIALADGLRSEAGPTVNITRQIRYGKLPLPTARPDPTGNFSLADVAVRDLLAGKAPAENIPVFPNDVITVPAAETVFVMGEVKRPGAVPLKDRSSISVLQALASAEGFGVAPAPQNARIVRVVGGTAERIEIPVDLKKALAGTAEDVPMRPDDILVVPPSGPKKAVTRAIEAAIQTATGVVIWRRP